MGIPLVQGRTFTDADRADAAPVAVIDQAFADRYFSGEQPIDRRARTTNDKTFREIIGVVGAVRQTNFEEAPEPHFYVAQAQNLSPVMTFVVRTIGEPEHLGSAVREAIRRIDPQQPIYNVRTLDAVAAVSVAAQRFNALLLTLFALLAVVLTLVGVYGLMAYWVTESTKEIGVRIALGATGSEVMRMVLGRSLRLTALGAAGGIGIALATVRFLAGLLYGVGPTDFATFAAATLFVMYASVLASYFPARRALAIDPADSLKTE